MYIEAVLKGYKLLDVPPNYGSAYARQHGASARLLHGIHHLPQVVGGGLQRQAAQRVIASKETASRVAEIERIMDNISKSL